MLREKTEVIKNAMIILDALIVTICYFLSFWIRQHIQEFFKFDLIPTAKILSEPPSALGQYLFLVFMVVPLWCMILYVNDMYGVLRTRSFFEVIWIIMKSSFFVLIGFGTLIFLFNFKFVSRLFFVIFLIASSTALLIEKLALFSIMHNIRKKGHNFRRLLIVGIGRRAVSVINKIGSSDILMGNRVKI
jgi:FlaA1/EpsC-like NDP-sugar epimerase